jgi:FkbM family methyltransferase
MAAALRVVVGRQSTVEIVEAAVADHVGRASLAVSERTPTVSTLADDWRQARRRDRGFERVDWNAAVDVETTTLDALIARFGVPVFIKLDIEGGESAALVGLSQPVRTVSFEFLPQALAAVSDCGTRLAALGPYRFNWTPAESHRLASSTWLPLDEVIRQLETATRHGDVYATLLEVHD